MPIIRESWICSCSTAFTAERHRFLTAVSSAAVHACVHMPLQGGNFVTTRPHQARAAYVCPAARVIASPQLNARVCGKTAVHQLHD